MTAVAVEFSPRRPLLDDLSISGELPYYTRPVTEPAPPLTAVTPITDLDQVMDSVKCSCNAGDDNPH